MSAYGFVLFHTTSAAFRAERALARAGIECSLVPTPREFSSDCGIAARFNWKDVEAVDHTLAQCGADVAGIHEAAG